MQSNIPNFSKIFKVSFFDFNKVQFQAVGILAAIVINVGSSVLVSRLGETSTAGQIANAVGGLLTAIVVLLTAAGVSLMIKADLLQESPVSSKEARAFIKRKFWPIIISPFLLLLTVLLLLGVQALLSFVGFIPFVGPIILAVCTIPAVILNVILAIALIVGSKLMPSIIAVEESNTIDTMKLTYQTCRVEPLRVAFYAGVLTLVGIGIFILPALAFLFGLLLTGAFHWSVLLKCYNSMLGYWSLDLMAFWFITGLSVLVMASLVIALPLTYFQGVYTYIYLSFKNKF
ncbi:MAG: hypothetical protein WC838_02295 [Candidatus Margulisiibacteriota bacterium]|jgi:hypothetical protein